MKIEELFEERKKKGTYAGVKFSDNTLDAVVAFCKENEIPRAIERDKLHTTLLSSPKHLPNYKAAGKYEEPLKGQVQGLDVWESSDGNRCLVLKYTCPELVARHKKLMKEHDAEFEYSSYKTHITFSYNIDDMDVDSLPKFGGPIEIVSEYSEELDPNWGEEEGGADDPV